MTPPTQNDFDRQEGVYAWTKTLASKESWTIRFGYSVTCPKGLKISG